MHFVLVYIDLSTMFYLRIIMQVYTITCTHHIAVSVVKLTIFSRKIDEGSDEKKTLVSFAKCTQLLGCLFPVKNGSSKESKDQSKDEVSEADENAIYIWIMKCLFPPKVIRYRLATIGKRHPRKVMGPTTDLYADVDEYTIAFNEVIKLALVAPVHFHT